MGEQEPAPGIASGNVQVRPESLLRLVWSEAVGAKSRKPAEQASDLLAAGRAHALGAADLLDFVFEAVLDEKAAKQLATHAKLLRQLLVAEAKVAGGANGGAAAKNGAAANGTHGAANGGGQHGVRPDGKEAAAARQRECELRLMRRVEALLGHSDFSAALLPKAQKVLHALYEGSVVEEEVLLEWFDRAAAAAADDAVCKAAAPFITWLREAEEDDED